MRDSGASCVSSTLRQSRHAESEAAFMHTDERGVIRRLMAGGKPKPYDLVCEAAGLTAALKPTVTGLGLEAFLTLFLLNIKLRLNRMLTRVVARRLHVTLIQLGSVF